MFTIQNKVGIPKRVIHYLMTVRASLYFPRGSLLPWIFGWVRDKVALSFYFMLTVLHNFFPFYLGSVLFNSCYSQAQVQETAQLPHFLCLYWMKHALSLYMQ